MLEWLKGKKTYILAIVTVALGVLQGLQIFTIPEWCWPVIVAAGLATLRDGVNSVASTVKEK